MSRSWTLFLHDMLECARKVERFTAECDMNQFVNDEMAYDAVLRNLEILGEAAKKIPDDVRRRYPDVNWRGVAGLRDLLAHAYFALDDATLWKIIQTDVRQLIPELERVAQENR